MQTWGVCVVDYKGMRSAAASGSERIYDILQFQSLNPLLVVESTKQLVDINNEIAHAIVSLKYLSGGL